MRLLLLPALLQIAQKRRERVYLEAQPVEKAAEMIDLDAIKQRADAATPGPWYSTWNDPITTPISDDEDGTVIRSEDERVPPADRVVVGSIWYDHSWAACTQPNAAFIAAARTDIPALVAEVERLQRIEAAAKAHLADWESGDTFGHESRAALKRALEGEL